ncbi:hypothetical protein D9M72_387090 [compost metagenome]
MPSEISPVPISVRNIPRRPRCVIASATWAIVHSSDGCVPTPHPRADAVFHLPAWTSEDVAQALDLIFVEVVVEVEAILWSRQGFWPGCIPVLAIVGSRSRWEGRPVCGAKLGDQSFAPFGCECRRKLAKYVYRERTHDNVRELSGKGDSLEECAMGGKCRGSVFRYASECDQQPELRMHYVERQLRIAEGQARSRLKALDQSFNDIEASGRHQAPHRMGSAPAHCCDGMAKPGPHEPRYACRLVERNRKTSVPHSVPNFRWQLFTCIRQKPFEAICNCNGTDVRRQSRGECEPGVTAKVIRSAPERCNYVLDKGCAVGMKMLLQPPPASPRVGA